jgi:hypothetical protein
VAADSLASLPHAASDSAPRPWPPSGSRPHPASSCKSTSARERYDRRRCAIRLCSCGYPSCQGGLLGRVSDIIRLARRAGPLGLALDRSRETPMDSTAFLRRICLVLASLAIVAGGLGMFASFLYLASRSMADITAGTSGFVAGAILIGAGLLSLTMLAIRPAHSASKEHSYSEID